MNTAMLYRGRQRQMRAGPKWPFVVSFTCTNCDGKNWVAMPISALIAGPNVRCWQCGVVCGVRARPSSGMDETLTEIRDIMERMPS